MPSSCLPPAVRVQEGSACFNGLGFRVQEWSGCCHDIDEEDEEGRATTLLPEGTSDDHYHVMCRAYEGSR